MEEEQLERIDWAQYQTAYGVATNVPDQLRRLASINHEVAMQASHDLWCGLCHQHAYVSSAALPALPFIVDVLRKADENLTVEILDIFLGIAICTTSERFPNPPDWIQQLRQEFTRSFSEFTHLTQHSNAEIADFAQTISYYLQQV